MFKEVPKRSVSRSAKTFIPPIYTTQAALPPPSSSYSLFPSTESMMELSLASDSHANPPYNTVFIDTSLDTHIAMIVSDVDTVADLKKKILLEHPLCFSSIGKIKIHALKVKRRGFFYHLSDSMFVRSAFDGVKRTWFLHVDASSSVEQSENQLACNPDSGNLLLCLPSADGVDLQPDEPSKKLSVLDESSLPQIKANQSVNEKVLSADEFGSGDPIVERSKVLEMEVKHISDDHHKTSFVSNKKSDPEEKCNQYSGEIELPGRHTKQKKNDNKIDDMQYNGSLEGALKTEPIPKKKQKIKNKHKDALSDHALKEDNAPPFHASGKDTSQQENVILENPVGNAGVKVPNDMKMGNKQISDDPGEKSSSEISKRSDYGVQKKHDPCEEIQVQGTHVECHDIKLKDTIDVQCNSSLGGIAQRKPAAKKKRKIVKNNESEGPVKENEALLCNFNKETSEAKIGSTENTLENEQKIINSNLEGLPTQPPEPNCLIRTSSSTGKRKRKKKSSNPCGQAVSEIPSEKDARQESSNATVEINHKDSGREFDTAIVPGESIQDATHSRPYALSLKEKYSGPVQAVEMPSSSPDIDMNEADASNMGRKSDVSELGAAYEVKRTKSSKKHHAVDGRDLSVKELDSLRKDLELSEQENVVPGDHLKLGIDQTDKSEGEKEMSLNNDPNGMLSEKCRLSRFDGSEMNMKEVIASSKLLDASVGMEHQKPAVKRKKSKKAKNSVEGTPVGSNMEHAKDTLNGFASTEPHNAFNGNHSSNEADKGESILSQTERTEVLKTKVKNTSLLGVDREIDAMSGNEMESFHLTHISKTQVNTEDMADAKVRKKTKKQSSTAKNLSDLQKKELDVGPEVSTSSTHKIKVDVPSKIKRKTKSVKTSSTNQFKRSKLETEKDAGTEVESLHPKQDPGTFDSSQIPSSYALENNPVGRPLEANVDGNLLKLACINEANDHKEVSSCQSDMVNMPRQSLHKVVAPAQVLADEDTKVKRSERVSKTNKNKKISNVDSVATSRDLQNSLKTNKSQDVEKKSEGDNQLQDPLSVDGHNKLMPESDSKFSKVSRNDLKSPHDIGKFDTIPEEIRWPNVVNASGTSSTAHAFLKENGKASLSTSSSDSSEDRTYQNKRGKRQSNLDRYRVTVRKAPRKNPGEVVNSSHQRKSLLATYGSIFNDGGSESSEDHDGVENSDASTRTPSDSSASSDYTEGENNQHLGSSHGLHSAKRNESGAKSIGKSNSSGSKNVTMDVILRSSSRFKKAKLTASQSELNDTESQPVEFVPDSQANL